jgi:hypothetical protein
MTKISFQYLLGIVKFFLKFPIPIPIRRFFFRIPIQILELGFHESTTESGQLLISGKKYNFLFTAFLAVCQRHRLRWNKKPKGLFSKRGDPYQKRGGSIFTHLRAPPFWKKGLLQKSGFCSIKIRIVHICLFLN